MPVAQHCFTIARRAFLLGSHGKFTIVGNNPLISRRERKLRNPNRLAAIDLGSNSFHLSIVQNKGKRKLKTIEKLGVKVQLAAGMKNNQLSDEAIQRGLDCLQRFAARITALEVETLRIVGTSALREAHNSDIFVQRAEQILGHKIEIISGEEEARLIYSGVAYERGRKQTLANNHCLVVDIGGGSTEIVVGLKKQCLLARSLPIGCVVYKERFFPTGEISQHCLDQAYQQARQGFASISNEYRQIGWQQVLGSSGTMQAIEQVLIAQDLSEAGISQQGLLSLKEKLLGFATLSEVRFEGLSEKRRSVFASGLAIVLALFDELELEHLSICKAALREGVLYELMNAQPNE